jgi:signal transduction histidine kinase
VSNGSGASPIRWLRFLGPWPFRPLVVFGFAWYFYLATATGQLLGQQNTDPADWIRSAALLAVPPAAAMATVVFLGRQWQRRQGIGVLSYVVVLVAAAFTALAVRLVIGALPWTPFTAPVPLLVGGLRNLVLVTFTLAVAGVLTKRLQEQVVATNAALDEVRVQQQLMLEADEAARRQVASLLHDRVQAGLIAACLELQMLSITSPGCDREAVLPIIAKLEDLRTLDVRRAARALSPDLHDVDLHSALEDLAAQYEPGMGTSIRVSADIDARRGRIGNDIVLAVYRIVEQALLNSATHGNARHARVEVDESHDVVSISVRDDGRGVGPMRNQGLGSAVLNTWTRHFDGDWSLTDHENGGARLIVHLRRHVTS